MLRIVVGILLLFIFLFQDQGGVLIDAQICDVQTAGNKEVLFFHPFFVDSTPITKTFTKTIDTVLRLSEKKALGGQLGLAWHTEKQRVADGFVSTFTLNIPGPQDPQGPADGFAFVVQNDKIVDLNGAGGASLGCAEIQKSVAIKFDLCRNRPNCNPISTTSISVEKNDVLVGAAVNLPVTLADGADHLVEIIYTGRLQQASANIIVKINGTERLSRTVGDLEAHFGGRFAFLGFSASTAELSTAQIDIKTWKFELQPSETAIDNAATKVQTFFLESTLFNITFRDSCRNQIAVPEINETTTVIQLKLQQPPETDPRDFVILTPQRSVVNGKLQLNFTIPERPNPNPEVDVVDVYDLIVKINGIDSAGSPFFAAVTAEEAPPPKGGLPLYALVLLLLAILFIVIGMSYLLYRLWRYRQKLKENEEFIEAGKKQAELNKLEDGTTYAMNPMMGTLDDLKTQLRKNEEELARLRALGQGGVDQEHTLAQLQKQRDGLLDEMNRLKKEQQNDEVGRIAGANVTAKPKTRKQFGAQSVEY